MSRNDKTNSTLVCSDNDLVANAASAGAEEKDASATIEESGHESGLLWKEAASLAHLKQICVAHGLDGSPLLAMARGLQSDIRDARRRTCWPTRINQFFGSQQW